MLRSQLAAYNAGWGYNWLMSKPSVLIAECDPTMAKFLMTNLKLLGCEGIVESTPEDAIRRGAALHPDFAFVARLMPGDGGALLATELQKASPKTTPMILDVLPDVGVSYAWESEKRFELFVVPSPLENLRSILRQKRKLNRQ
jgi:hypothetical protein